MMERSSSPNVFDDAIALSRASTSLVRLSILGILGIEIYRDVKTTGR